MAARKKSDYLEAVDLIGEVRQADLDGCHFSLRLDDGTKVQGKFTPEQESLITEALREHSTRRLRVKGRMKGAVSKKRIARLDSVDELTVQPVADKTPPPDGRPIWEVIVELGASVPDEEWAKVPTDGAKNLHHYLYGAPKEED